MLPFDVRSKVWALLVVSVLSAAVELVPGGAVKTDHRVFFVRYNYEFRFISNMFQSCIDPMFTSVYILH